MRHRLVAEDQQPLRLESGEHGLQRALGSDLGKGEDAALLDGFDRIRAHPVEIEPRDLCAAGQHGLKHASAHLDRLLGDIIEPRMLQGREEIMEIRHGRLGAGLAQEPEAGLFSAFGADGRKPFAIAPVEDEHRIVRLHPEHVEQVIRLLPLQRQPASSRQSMVQKKAVTGKIWDGHLRGQLQF
jgi:hypothetical protein